MVGVINNDCIAWRGFGWSLTIGIGANKLDLGNVCTADKTIVSLGQRRDVDMVYYAIPCFFLLTLFAVDAGYGGGEVLNRICMHAPKLGEDDVARFNFGHPGVVTKMTHHVWFGFMLHRTFIGERRVR
eukprot:465622_1